jgi:hypothetical protein
MKTPHRTLPLAGLIAGGTLLALSGISVASAKDRITQAEMPGYCKREAAQAFGVREYDISTQSVERNNDKYFVHGQTPAFGNNALHFHCKFDDDHHFVKVEQDSDNRHGNQAGSGYSGGYSGGYGGSRGMSDIDMINECKRQAASAFNVREYEVQTLPVERNDNKYQIFGQTPKETSNALLFHCKFDGDRAFVKVVKDSDNRNSYNSGGGYGQSNHSGNRIAYGDMSKYCGGEASAKFGWRRMSITTQSPIRANSGIYTVMGQYDDSPRPHNFRCTFTSDGYLDRVDRFD